MTAAVDCEVYSVLAGVLAATESLRTLLRELGPDRVWTQSPAEVVRLLRAQADLAGVVEAAGLALVRQADVLGLAADNGQTCTAVWLAQLLRLHPAEAKTRVKTADVLARQGAATAAALAAGRVNPDQARTIATALCEVAKVGTAEEVAEAEATLLAEGRVHHAGNLRRLGEHIVAVLDPDGVPEKEERAKAERSFTITNLGNGRHRLRGVLGDEAAAIVNAALDPLAAPRPASEGEKDPRTATQRRADAVTDLAAHYLRHGDAPASRGARPHVVITATADTVNGDTAHPYARTATGENISADTLRKICCDAGITPIVVNTLGEPLSVGRKTRIVPPPMWAALVARDLGCIRSGCTRPASWSQAHHVVHWSQGGETKLSNLVLFVRSRPRPGPQRRVGRPLRRRRTPGNDSPAVARPAPTTTTKRALETAARRPTHRPRPRTLIGPKLLPTTDSGGRGWGISAPDSPPTQPECALASTAPGRGRRSPS